jgi:hypothetical protein
VKSGSHVRECSDIIGKTGVGDGQEEHEVKGNGGQAKTKGNGGQAKTIDTLSSEMGVRPRQ